MSSSCRARRGGTTQLDPRNGMSIAFAVVRAQMRAELMATQSCLWTRWPHCARSSRLLAPSCACVLSTPSHSANCAVPPKLDPDRARYAYVYAVGLHSAGQVDDAMAVLTASLARHPGDRDTLLALVSYSRDAGDFGTALNYAEQLAREAPDEPGLTALIENLRRQVKNPVAR